MSTTKKIKVMHVAECVGGVDKYLHCLIKYMDHDKFENIAVLSQLYNAKEYGKLADSVEVLNMAHGMGPKTIASAKDIRKLIKKYNPDIVYAHSSIAGAVTRLANIGLKPKCVYNPHGWSFNMQSSKQPIYVALEKVMSHFCNKIVCISNAEKNSALKNKVCKEDKLQVIFNGIEVDRKPKKTRKELGIPEDAFVVGMVGRICKQKAPDTFIKMAEHIKDAYFVIVGDVLEGKSEERKEIEELAVKYNANLKITGWVDNVLDYIGTFDVACLLSRWEGFGLALPEYMLCGKPIVANNVDAIPNIVQHEKNGLLVEVDDYESAAKAVMRIREDENLREKLINNAKKDVFEKYDVKRVSAEHGDMFMKMLDKKC